MKTSIEWLNDYLDRPADADEVERLLTDQGMPIDGRSPVAGGDDVLLDVEVTSNRSDCLSHAGLAREVAAGSGRRFITPVCELPGADSDIEAVGILSSVALDAPGQCPLYTARVIRGVKVGPSPPWLVSRLEAVGLRSVNNIVDITNFVLMELGQPLHTFDLGVLRGRRVVVRNARSGEGFAAIDGSRHELREGMLVIADTEVAVAVAGVMGGLDSRVTEATSDILLESALFDPLSVRRTSRALKLASDSSYRFERGVDPLGVEIASRRAAALICELAGGKLAAGVIREGEAPPKPQAVAMRIDRCNQVLGLSLKPGRMVQWLDRLGFAPMLDDAAGSITCNVPTYRLDVHREIDLIEEVARLEGFGSVPVTQKIHIITRPPQPVVRAKQKAGEVLVAHGYHEAVTFSSVSLKHGQPFVPSGHTSVFVEDDHRKAQPMLRPSILPSLLACRKSNQDVGNTDVRLFEWAATWLSLDGQVVERNRLAVLRDAEDPQAALRALRGTLDELIERLAGAVGAAVAPTDVDNFSAAVEVLSGGRALGVMGVIDLPIQQLFDLQTPVVAVELDIDVLLENYPPTYAVEPLARFPAIERDLSVMVEDRLRWHDLQDQVLTVNPDLLEDVRFIGVYRGKPIPKGKKSVSFRLLFRDPASTLRHEQVDPQVAAVVQRLETQLGAQLRV